MIKLSRNTDTVKRENGSSFCTPRDAATKSVATTLNRFCSIRTRKRVFIQRGEDGEVLFSERRFNRGDFDQRIYCDVEQSAAGCELSSVSKCRGLKVVLEELMKEDRVDLAKRVKDNKCSDFEWLLSRREEEDNRKRSQRTRVNLVAHPSNDSVSVTEAIHTALRRKKSVTSSLSDSSKK